MSVNAPGVEKSLDAADTSVCATRRGARTLARRLDTRVETFTIKSKSEAGVTLIELMIAVTLVAALSVGMLMAMRTSLVTLEKIDGRLQSNRRIIGVDQILTHELGGAIPIANRCPNGDVPFFTGTAQTLRIVSGYSLLGAERGFPQILEFQVVPADGGGVRLIVNESPYTGPASIVPFCPIRLQPAAAGKDSFVLGDHLAYCRISYRESIHDSVLAGRWVEVWDRPNFPVAVRFDMAQLVPDPGKLPVVSVSVRLHVTRDVLAPYADQQP